MNGKGSRRRESSITDSQFKAAWARIFAKRAKNKRARQKRADKDRAGKKVN